MSDYDSYQTNVGKAQGAETIFVKSGGNILVESGGTIDVDGYMDFYGTVVTGSQLARMMLARATQTQYISSVSVLAASVISPTYGYAFFSLAAGCSKASIRLDAGTKYDVLVLQFYGLVSNAVVSVIPSGVSLVGLNGSDISGLTVHASLMSIPIDLQATLICTADNVWTVVDKGAGLVSN